MAQGLSILPILICAAAAGCSGSSGNPAGPAGPSGGGTTLPPSTLACRTYSAQETRVFASSNGLLAGTSTQTCTFNMSANEASCTLNYSDTQGAAYSVTVVARYASKADFVDEVQVIPALSLAVTGSTTYGPSSLGGRNSTWVFSYDTQRRQTQRASQFSDGSIELATFTGWDAAGRPTGATLSGSSPTTLLYAYDDAARTWTITTPSIGAVQTHTYDTNGNLVSTVSTVSGVTTTSTVTITGTGSVCK